MSIIIVQVIEFVQFKERLQHSYQYLMARMDASILQMKQKTDKLEDVEVKCLVYNRYSADDLTALMYQFCLISFCSSFWKMSNMVCNFLNCQMRQN